MIAVTDPFMAGTATRRPGDFERTTKGVPLVADPVAMLKDGSRPKRVMYRRPSSFGKQIENTYNLQKWGERQQALGFALDFNLLKRAMALLEGDRESKAWKDEADEVVVAAKDAAKAWIAAERGTHTHGLAEDDDIDINIIARIEHGETLGLLADVQRSLVEAWQQMLAANSLEIVAVEFAVVNDTYRAAGTGDRVAKLTRPLRFRLITGELIELADGTYVILDIKTGQRRLDNQGVVMYWQSYAVQVALYAPPGAMLYDPDTDTRTPFPWPVSEDWALIAHLDVLGAIDGRPSCELVLVDLKAGRAAADLCVAAREWENETTVFSVAQLDVPVVPIVPDGAPSSTGATLVSEPVENPSSPAPDSDTFVRKTVTVTKSGTYTFDDYVITPPDRLKVVDARKSLATEPSQGADLSDAEYELLWAKIRHEHAALPDTARDWVNDLSAEARRHNVTFHTKEVQTERSYYLCKALVTIAGGGGDIKIVRVLASHVLGDAAFVGEIPTGLLVGSLDHTQATRLALLADQWVAGPDTAA